MKKSIILALVTLVMGLGSAQATEKIWTLDPSHSNIKFSVKYLKLADVDGRFTNAEAKVVVGKDFTDAKVDVAIDVNSVNTDNAKRDDHLKSPDFFDVKKFPKITFKSKSIKKVDEQNYVVAGDLTMHGVTKPVELKTVYLGQEKDAFGNTRSLLVATTSLKRFDYGIKFNKLTDAGAIVVSDEVEVKLNLQFIAAK